jgi:hypothetical protein
MPDALPGLQKIAFGPFMLPPSPSGQETLKPTLQLLPPAPPGPLKVMTSVIGGPGRMTASRTMPAEWESFGAVNVNVWVPFAAAISPAPPATVNRIVTGNTPLQGSPIVASLDDDDPEPDVEEDDDDAQHPAGGVTGPDGAKTTSSEHTVASNASPPRTQIVALHTGEIAPDAVQTVGPGAVADLTLATFVMVPYVPDSQSHVVVY